jgi:glyoxylase-like metal-dependent hydrolase (beta-lactamase superfamily II)
MRIDRIVTSGVFSLDGQRFDVDNNVWLLGDDDEVLVVDAPHDATAIERAIGGRRVVAIVCTHAHNDHVNAAVDLRRAVGGRIMLHPGDLPLWRMTHPDDQPDDEIRDGAVVEVAGSPVRLITTPGHTPGGVCLHVPDDGVLFTGDTLFNGGPGATGRSFSDFPTILTSIRERLLTLPPETDVRTGHGDSTTIGAEASHYDEWVVRGH